MGIQGKSLVTLTSHRPSLLLVGLGVEISMKHLMLHRPAQSGEHNRRTQPADVCVRLLVRATRVSVSTSRWMVRVSQCNNTCEFVSSAGSLVPRGESGRTAPSCRGSRRSHVHVNANVAMLVRIHYLGLYCHVTAS